MVEETLDRISGRFRMEPYHQLTLDDATREQTRQMWLELLIKQTGQNFGYDEAKWRKWLTENFEQWIMLGPEPDEPYDI